MSIEIEEFCLTMIIINNYNENIMSYAEKLVAAQNYSSRLNEYAEAMLRGDMSEYQKMLSLSLELNQVITDIMAYRKNWGWVLDGEGLLMAQ